jgi:hypothetical protein
LLPPSSGRWLPGAPTQKTTIFLLLLYQHCGISLLRFTRPGHATRGGLRVCGALDKCSVQGPWALKNAVECGFMLDASLCMQCRNAFVNHIYFFYHRSKLKIYKYVSK